MSRFSVCLSGGCGCGLPTVGDLPPEVALMLGLPIGVPGPDEERTGRSPEHLAGPARRGQPSSARRRR